MATVSMAALKPSYVAKAAGKMGEMAGHIKAAGKANAMANHPAGASRASEFHAQAQQHSGMAGNNAREIQAMTTGPVTTLSGEFQGANNAQYN